MRFENNLSRRAFMLDLGRGTAAVAIFGLAAACSAGDPADSSSSTESVTTSAATEPPGPATASNDAPSSSTSQATQAGTSAVVWERVNLGFVSAYVLARRGEATVVDTGVAGSEGAIEEGLARLDLGWTDVGQVIVTHLHDDHQGSLPAVLDLAADATAYAGAADIPGITSPRELVAVGDGDRVFGLEIIDTPGHTPGHISIFDPIGGLLVAGDAMNGADGGVIGANPQFTADMDTADESIKKLAALTFDTVVFGHGEPVIGGASQLVADLAAAL
jgi:glyoxylase-like metal-dependent hydrolase (beta-lactamase superfamily II)